MNDHLRVGAGIVAVAACLAPVGDVQAATLDLVYGPTSFNNRWPPDGYGFGVGADFWADHALSLQARFDVSRNDDDSPASVTFGPRLGWRDGTIHPYAELIFGFSGGQEAYTGFNSGWGVGLGIDLTNRVGVVVMARSDNLGNWEYSEHLTEYRAGVTLRTAPR